MSDATQQKPSAGVDAAFKAGLHNYGIGNFTDAEANFTQVLQAQPDHFNALNLLGILKQKAGDYASAVALISKSILIRSDVPEAYSNLVNALEALGRFDEAREHYYNAIAHPSRHCRIRQHSWQSVGEP